MLFRSPSALTIGTYEIQIVSADGGKPERLSGSRGIELSCTWSRDGKWIYFDSDRGGKVQVWKVPAGGGDPVQVTRQEGTCGLESLDGKFVYYLLALVNEGSNTELWRVPAEGGEEIRIVDSVCPQLFAVAERGIYFFSGWKSPLIQRFRFATRKIETVARVEGKIGWGISVSPEDRWLLYSVLEEQSDLMMVEKFR